MTVAVVLAFEAALHLDVVRNRLPNSRIYYTNHVEPRHQALRGTLEKKGRVDVLFVGSSIVRTNFRPFIFDSIVEARSGRKLVSFNGGLSGLPPDGVRLYLEHFFLPRITPEYVVQGIRYPEILRTEPADQVEPLQHGIVEPLWTAPGPVNRVEAWAWEHVALLRHRGLLGRILQARASTVPRPRTYAIDSRGWNRRDTTLAERIARERIEPITPHPEPHNPQDLEKGLEILRRTVNLVRARGAEYVLVNVPEHPDRFGGPVAKERYRAYVCALERFAEKEGIRFIDVTAGEPDRYRNSAWYFDGHHMTSVGARRFTEAMAVEWSKVADRGWENDVPTAGTADNQPGLGSRESPPIGTGGTKPAVLALPFLRIESRGREDSPPS